MSNCEFETAKPKFSTLKAPLCKGSCHEVTEGLTVKKRAISAFRLLLEEKVSSLRDG